MRLAPFTVLLYPEILNWTVLATLFCGAKEQKKDARKTESDFVTRDGH